MSRNGKIARLPASLREQVNRRLDNGEPGRDILLWLNAEPEARAVLDRDFAGQEISDSNLTHWRQGGFVDWQRQQETVAETERILSEGLELEQLGEKALTERLAVWLVGRYIAATRRLVESTDAEASWKLLRELSHNVVALRRGDHTAARLRLTEERLKLQQQKQAGKDRKSDEEEGRKEGRLKPLTEEEREAKYRAIFGMNPKPSPFELAQRRACAEPETPAPTEPVKPNQSDAPEPLNQPVKPEEPAETELQHIIRLAENGDGQSAYCLGARYRDGFGVPQDIEKAREWLSRAVARGIGGAKIQLHALEAGCYRWDRLRSPPAAVEAAHLDTVTEELVAR